MFSRPETVKQNSSVSGPVSWIGTEDGRLASVEVMLEGIIFCVYIHTIIIIIHNIIIKINAYIRTLYMYIHTYTIYVSKVVVSFSIFCASLQT